MSFPLDPICLCLQVTLLLQPSSDLGHTLLYRVLVRLDGDLWVGRLLVRGRDTGELLDLARPSLLVQSLRVTLLGDLKGYVNKDLNEGQLLVLAAAGLGVQLARHVAVSPVRRDEGGDGNGGRVGKELGDLTNAADVLVAVLLGEAQVLVQTEAHVVAIETVGGQPQVEEMLLEGGSDGGLARGGEAGEPDGQALLLAGFVALLAREGGVPGDVAAGSDG